MLKFDGMLLLLMLELGKVDDILLVHAYDTINWLINFLTSKEMNNHVYHSIIQNYIRAQNMSNSEINDTLSSPPPEACAVESH